MKIINCTPHPISIMLNSKVETYEASGIIPRVETTKVFSKTINGIEFFKREKGNVAGLPEVEEGVYYIVSGMVFDMCDREDIIAPNTDETAIRDSKGRIIAVTSFLTK